MTNTIIPEQLIFAAKNNQLIPIIGAGVSMSVTNKNNQRVFPSWQELLLRAADEIEKQDKDQADYVRLGVKKQKWQRAAEDAKEGLTGEDWHNFLEKQFSIDYSQLNPLSANLPKAIWQLSNNIINLNYDKIQQHFSATSTNVAIFDNTNADQLGKFAVSSQEAHQKFIWHLHGHIDAPANIVLTPDSYQALYEQAEQAEQKEQAAIAKLKSLVISHYLLFIGCSLDDAELIAQIAEQQQVFGQSSKTHYALVRKSNLAAFEQKLASSKAKIKLIPFEDFGEPLIKLIEQISAKPEPEKVIEPKPAPVKTPKEKPQNASQDSNPILLLTANPLDWLNDDKTYNAERHNPLITALNKSPYGITHKPLTEENLLNADDYSYVVIASRIESDEEHEQPSILIENEYLHSESYCLIEALNQLEGVNGVICIFDAKPDFEHINPSTDTPVIFHYNESEKITKSFIGAFISQWLKGFRSKFFDKKGLIAHNQSNFKPLDEDIKKLTANTPAVRQNKNSLPSLIDPNNLKNFIGRNQIQQDLAEALISQAQDKIITIKGLGGMGKTTLAKKLAAALAERDTYPQGINFIDCESIENFTGFTRQIAESFDLGQVQKPLEKITQLDPQNKLLILDNFETVLGLNSPEDVEQSISLVKTIYRKCNILVTSRQGLNLNVEDIHEIDQLSPLDAEKLFINLAKDDISNLNASSNNELLSQILDEQLNYSPLAITLICQNLMENQSLQRLHDDLSKDPFAELEESEQYKFANDTNSERLKSIYNSIMYSYQTLKEDEKQTLELLALFPDGVEYDTFERFVAKAKLEQRKKNSHNHWQQNTGQQAPQPLTKSTITRSAIKALSHKSLLENNQGHIGLQSLIGKFAELQLQKRDNQQHYYQQLLEHMQTFVSGLIEEHKRDEISAIDTYNKQYNNILKAISAYIKLKTYFAAPVHDSDKEKASEAAKTYQFNQNKHQLFDRLLKDTSNLAEQACNQLGFINALQSLLTAKAQNAATKTITKNIVAKTITNNFISDPSTALIQSLLIRARYYNGDFRVSFNELQKSLPRKQISKLCAQPNLDNNQQKILLDVADIYSMEGHALTGALVCQQLKWFSYDYPQQLFYLGEYQQKLADNCHLARPSLCNLSVKAFFITQNADKSYSKNPNESSGEDSNTQIIEMVNDAPKTYSLSNHLRRVEIIYFKSQYTKIPVDEINALVEVNPFTSGLKQLMLAFNIQNTDEQQNLYLQAINNLEHIKYYWVEAKWHYVKFLISSNKKTQNSELDSQINQLIKEGQDLCEKYHFRYLHYRFDCLEAQLAGFEIKPYNTADYPLPGNPDFTSLINVVNKCAKLHYRTHKAKN